MRRRRARPGPGTRQGASQEPSEQQAGPSSPNREQRAKSSVTTDTRTHAHTGNATCRLPGPGSLPGSSIRLRLLEHGHCGISQYTPFPHVVPSRQSHKFGTTSCMITVCGPCPSGGLGAGAGESKVSSKDTDEQCQRPIGGAERRLNVEGLAEYAASFQEAPKTDEAGNEEVR